MRGCRARPHELDLLLPPNSQDNKNGYAQSFLPENHQTTDDSQPDFWPFKTVAEIHAALDACATDECLYSTAQGTYSTDQKDYKLNYAAHADGSHTFEFRSHSSTLDLDTISSWIKLTNGIVSASLHGSLDLPASEVSGPHRARALALAL